MNYREHEKGTFLKQRVGVFFPSRHERNWKGEPRARNSKFYLMINETINNKLIVIMFEVFSHDNLSKDCIRGDHNSKHFIFIFIKYFHETIIGIPRVVPIVIIQVHAYPIISEFSGRCTDSDLEGCAIKLKITLYHCDPSSTIT